jgi:hypothetical protein
MDDYLFRSYVKDCICVTEATSYLEIFNYSVSCWSPLSFAPAVVSRGR